MTQNSPLSLVPAKGGLASLTLTSPAGSTLEVYAYGAHVTSWVVAGKGEQLFVSEKALFAEGKAIRGGVPVIFPQFGAFGPGAKHGFARNLVWQLNTQLSAAHTAIFELHSSPETLALWPFQFAAQMKIILGDNDLRLELRITNTDVKPCEFTCALHSYFAVAELAETAINGLSGCAYWDNGNPFEQRHIDNNPELLVSDALDRVYFEARDPLQLEQPLQTLFIDSIGFADTVVWNPGRAGAAALADFSDEEYRKMLCIESAVVANPVVLEPGKSWLGEQILRVE